MFRSNEIFLNGERCYSQEDLPGKYKISINGTGNRLELHSVQGKGSITISLEDAINVSVKIGSGNTVNRSLRITFYSVYGKQNDGSSVVVGNDNIFNGDVHILAPLEVGHAVKIGNKNLFAGGISLRGCDEHTVFDMNTKEKLNKEMGITVHDHIWVCEQAWLLNGAEISSNSVVAARAIVTKAFLEENVLLAGSPAKVRKQQIDWDRKYQV